MYFFSSNGQEGILSELGVKFLRVFGEVICQAQGYGTLSEKLLHPRSFIRARNGTVVGSYILVHIGVWSRKLSGNSRISYGESLMSAFC